MESNGKMIKSYTNPKPIDVVFQNLTYSVSEGAFKREKKTILNSVSGHFKSGELTAILGPSGAGKTTLLNILTGFGGANNIGGFVTTVNHLEGIRGNRLDSKDRSYILQDDELSPFFTVREIMTIAADLKLGKTETTKMKQKIIENILAIINLTKTKDTRCAKLSGGEKKRLSIALELITNPPVMFLDEPTTGLDSVSCYQCITILKNLAKGDRTIVCTIHQPSALLFELFDHVYVIADGSCVYQGSPDNVIPFLRSVDLQCQQYHNPADFIIEVINGDYGDFNSKLVGIANKRCWRGFTSEKIINNGQMRNGDTKYNRLHVTPSEFHRFIVLVEKYAVKFYRDWTMSHLRVVIHFSVGIFMGLLYAGFGEDASKVIPNFGFLITTLVYSSYTSMMPAVLKFPSELNIVKKERFNNWYKLSTFYLAFIFVNIPLQILFTTVYVVPAYFLSSQMLSFERFFKFSLICLIVNLTSEAFGLFFGINYAIADGVFLGSVFACCCFLFNGYFLLLPHIQKPWYYISYSSFCRYATSATIHAVYGYDRKPLDCPKSKVYCMLRYPRDILKFFGVVKDEYSTNVLIMMCFMISFYVISFLSLRHRITKR